MLLLDTVLHSFTDECNSHTTTLVIPQNVLRDMPMYTKYHKKRLLTLCTPHLTAQKCLG